MEINLTNPYDIIETNKETIKAFYEKRENMVLSALEFTKAYDEYIFNTMKDGALLKARMKEAVIKGTNKDE